MKRLLFIFGLALLTIGASLPPSQLAPFFEQSAAGGGPYIPETAGFDTGDFMVMNGAPTGFADAKTFTWSVWYDFTGGDSTLQFLYWSANSRFLLFKSPTNTINFTAATVGGTVVWNVSSSVTKTAADGWFHLLVVADANGAGTVKMYFDGVDDTSKVINTHSDNTIDLDVAGTPSRRIGKGSVFEYVFASTADFWLANRAIDDVSKFYNAGEPVDLGADGSTPDGTKPGFYFSRNGSGDSWIVDSANGNTFTLTGALGSPTPP